MCRVILTIIAALILQVLSFIPAQAWGGKGHQVIVKAALEKLTSQERDKIFEIVGTRDIDTIANWADWPEAGRKSGTEQSHYINIPKDAGSIGEVGEFSILGRLHSLEQQLRMGNLKPEAKRSAMLYYIHLLGDLFQPFHAFDDGSRGGNDTHIRFQGKSTNLHKLWDTDLIEAQHQSIAKLSRSIGSEPVDTTRPFNDYSHWAMRSHDIARDFDVANGATVSGSYERRAWDATLGQLRLASSITTIALQTFLGTRPEKVMDVWVDLAEEPKPIVPLETLIEYPEVAKRAGLEGKVVVQALISKEGTIEKAEILHSDNDVFNDAALSAIRGAKFSPARDEHHLPVRVWVTRTIKFKLSH